MDGSSREEWYEDYMRIMDEEYGDYGFKDDPVILEELAIEEEQELSKEWRSKNKALISSDDEEEECNVPAEVVRLRDIESPEGIKKLKRDLRLEMLRRLEQAARTVTDFRNLNGWYDYLEELERHRTCDHEIYRSGDEFPLEYGAKEDGAVFPAYLGSVIELQLRKGDFLDAIYCKPDTIDQLVTNDYLIHFMRALDDYEKQVVYYEIMENLSSNEIGNITGRTDRAIRKKWRELEEHLKQRTMGVLIFRSDKDYSFTGDEQRFLDTCREKYEFKADQECNN